MAIDHKCPVLVQYLKHLPGWYRLPCKGGRLVPENCSRLKSSILVSSSSYLGSGSAGAYRLSPVAIPLLRYCEPYRTTFSSNFTRFYFARENHASPSFRW